MAFDYNKAFTVTDNGVAFADADGNVLVSISAGSVDPSVSGWDAPVGSLFLRTDGTSYTKFNTGTTDWNRNVTFADQMRLSEILAFAAAHG